MPTDGDAHFDAYSGAQLLQALDTIDRSRYPRNFQALRQEIATRPAPGKTLVEGSEVVEFSVLPADDRRALLKSCMWKVLWLQLQYWLLGVLVNLVLGLVFRGVGVAGSSRMLVGVYSVVMLIASFAAFWAYTRWLLRESIDGFAFRLLRTKRDGA